MSARRPPRVNAALTERLLKNSLPLLTAPAIALAKKVQIFVVGARKGKASITKSRVTVPNWVYREQINFCSKGMVAGGDEFAAYYLAHELAHIGAQDRHHSAAFMSTFRAYCPEYLQHYELAYKPRAARQAGIVALSLKPVASPGNPS